jgi:hypothetical protein
MFAPLGHKGKQPFDVYGYGRLGTVTSGTGYGGASGIVNEYGYSPVDIANGSTQIVVEEGAGGLSFTKGDIIFIHQTQQYSSSLDAGEGEINYVNSATVSGSRWTVKLALPVGRTFYSGTFNSTSSRVTQIIRVPQYENLTLSGNIYAKQWDGYTGGICMMMVSNTLNCSTHYIHAIARGFRGGGIDNAAISQSQGYQGESWNGVGTRGSTNYVRNNTGGGGHHGPLNTGGTAGAGGGHATAGTNSDEGGDSTSSPGTTHGDDDLSRLTFGGGGGMGGDNDDRCFGEYMRADNGSAYAFIGDTASVAAPTETIIGLRDVTVPGGTASQQYNGVTTSNFIGAGGGAVRVFAKNITNGRFDARGFPPASNQSGGSKCGAGAGGSIHLICNTASITDADVRGYTKSNSGASALEDAPGGSGQGRFYIEQRDEVVNDVDEASTPSYLQLTPIGTGSATTTRAPRRRRLNRYNRRVRWLRKRFLRTNR